MTVFPYIMNIFCEPWNFHLNVLLYMVLSDVIIQPYYCIYIYILTWFTGCYQSYGKEDDLLDAVKKNLQRPVLKSFGGVFHF